MAAFYGPAFYLPVAYIGRWTHADIHGLFMIGRWISLLATLVTGGLIIGLLRARWGVHPAIAAMMGLVFLTADDVFCRHDISFRPDAAVCLLTLVAGALLTRSDKAVSLYATVLIFLLAFLYKQSSIAGPPSVALWLWLSNKRRQAVAYALTSVAVFVGTVLLLNGVTQGQYYLNAVEALKGNTTVLTIPYLFHELVKVAALPLAVSVYAMIEEWSWRKWDIMSILLAATLLLSMAGT